MVRRASGQETSAAGGLRTAVEAVKTMAKVLSEAKCVSVATLKIGRPARKATLAKAKAAGVPDELLELCALMDGFELSWSSGSDPHLRFGGASFQSLSRHMAGREHTITLDPELEEASDSIYELDTACRTLSPCWICGDSGTWDSYNATFTCDGPSIQSYLETGVANLFVDEWYDHFVQTRDDELHPDALVVRKLIGLE